MQKIKKIKNSKKRIISFIFSQIFVFSLCFVNTSDIIPENQNDNKILSVYSEEKNLEEVSNEKKYVIPSGETIGIKMYTKGLLVVGISSVTDTKGEKVYPAKIAGIKEGDIILKADGRELNTNENLSKIINSKKDNNVNLLVDRNGNVFETVIVPALEYQKEKYKVGLWVRDSTAGIGTMTFYDPQNNTFGALGHAITDADTQKNLTVSKGDIVGCKIQSAIKGKNGVPGELIGIFENKVIGNINVNNDFGMYGTVNNNFSFNKENLVEVGNRFLIKEGKAHILSDVDGKGVKSYEILIESVSKSDEINNRGISIKVTDENLLNITGGIVQGMSGSPILQNGKLVGAVTHVFINDSTRGYGIFIENMLSEVDKVK